MRVYVSSTLKIKEGYIMYKKLSLLTIALTVVTSSHAAIYSCPLYVNCPQPSTCEIVTQSGDSSIFSPAYANHANQFNIFLGASVDNVSGFGRVSCYYSDNPAYTSVTVSTVGLMQAMSYDSKSPKNWCKPQSDPTQCQFED